MGQHAKNVSAVCEVDKTRLAAAAEVAKKASGKKPLAFKSGREDLNLRPPEPHSGALAKLRHGPIRPMERENPFRSGSGEFYRARPR